MSDDNNFIQKDDNTDNANNNSINSSINNEGEGYITQSNNATNLSNNTNSNGIFSKWKSIELTNRIQIVIAASTLISIICFIVFSITQTIQTKKAINRADTANYYAKIAIDSTNADRIKADSINRISDSLNRKSIEIADSSMKISKKMASIQEKYTKIELQAYITIVEVMPYFFEVGRNFRTNIHFVNYGKTPAFNIKCFSGYRLGNPEFIKRDMKHLKEFKITSTDTKGADLDGMFECDYGKIIDSTMSVDIRSGKIQYFVFGYITYDNVFGDNHKVEFSYIYSTSNDEMKTYEYN